MWTKIRYLILAVLLIGALALSPFRPLKVEGRSMEPTFKDGQTLLLDQLYWRTSGLKRGDIVVLRKGEERWVKRLAGLPGDRMLVQTRLDGAVTEVDNLTVRPEAARTGQFLRERVLADDEIFVMGDNLNHSADSTQPGAGKFQIDDVLGVARSFTFGRDFALPRRLAQSAE